MVPIFDAVFYCHQLGITHRDLKLENLLLTSHDLGEAAVKITDFGLAREVDPANLAETICGSPSYVAPEILSSRSYDHRCDYWSLGVVLYILACGSPPFQHEDKFELFALIKEGKLSFEQAEWGAASDEFRDFIKRLLTVEPDERIGAEEVTRHPWYARVY